MFSDDWTEQRRETDAFIVRSYRSWFTEPWAEVHYAKIVSAHLQAIAELGRALAEVEAEPPDRFPWRLGYESKEGLRYLIEMEVGTVLVICQVYITRVAGLVRHFCSDLSGLAGIAPPWATERADLVRTRGARVEGTSYTIVDAIDALANYFKHNDEWEGPWSGLPPKARRTAEIVSALGACSSRSFFFAGNLRACLLKLGIESPTGVVQLFRYVDEWKAELWKEYADHPFVAARPGTLARFP